MFDKRLVLLVILLNFPTLVLAERRDIRTEAVFAGGPSYGDIVEEFCAASVFPARVEYMGIGVARDNVICERVERDGNSWWVTCRARYSGRVQGVKIGAERVRIYYDNGHIKVDLGGIKGALNSRALEQLLDTGISRWARTEYKGHESLALSFDAAVEHRNGKVYFFRDTEYMRFDFEDDTLERIRPIGSPGWKGVWTDGIDAAILHPNGFTYFFKGSQYMKFDTSDGIDTVVRGYPRSIDRDGWKGVWTNGIDAALVHPNGKGYFFQGNKYRRFNFAKDKDEVEFEGVIGVDGWKGLWDDGIDAALMHRNGKAYFFQGNKYQRFDFEADEVTKTGTIGRSGWKGLGE